MGDHRSTEEIQMDSLVDVLDGIREELEYIHAAMHQCEYSFELVQCIRRADRRIDGRWLCEIHADKAEAVSGKEQAP